MILRILGIFQEIETIENQRYRKCCAFPISQKSKLEKNVVKIFNFDTAKTEFSHATHFSIRKKSMIF